MLLLSKLEKKKISDKKDDWLEKYIQSQHKVFSLLYILKVVVAVSWIIKISICAQQKQ